MNRYVFRRLALIPLVLTAVNFFGFAYAYLVRPGQLARNPFLAVTAEPIPVLPAYLEYIRGLLHSDLGALPPSGAPLGPIVLEATIASLGLLAAALILSVVVGLSLGVVAVRTPGQQKRFGTSEGAGIAPWLTLTTTVGLAMPSFYIGSLLILATLAYLIWGPQGAVLPVQGFGWDLHLVLPALVLAARAAAQIAQMSAALLAAELDKTYVVAARSLGQSWRTIRRRHALWNVAAPIAVVVFAAVRVMVAELIIVEWLFSWPGLGRLLAWTLIPPAVSDAPRPVFLYPPALAAVLTMMALILLLADLASGLLARIFDPRLRAATQRAEGSAYD
jgi:peptide/nickel transport system permease protein